MKRKKRKGVIISSVSTLLLMACFITGINTINNGKPKNMAITKGEVQGPDCPTVEKDDVSYVEIDTEGRQYAVTDGAPVAVTPMTTGEAYIVNEAPSDADVLSANGANTQSETDDWGADDEIGTAAYVPK